ncbi:NAD(P)H-binding protein [Solicola sp. PLA-1-18]|uniref:NAD(P)H-binding protein n=1 Tax=Solicola sp. PLA-1-18 TaxID=3380532 RepID=UPI003B81236B
MNASPAAAGTNRVLVTGVRGKTGVPLAELLASRGDVEVLGGSSDPSTVTQDGVRPVAFSWDDPSGWPAALDGVDAIYLVRPDRPDAPELVAAFLADVPADVRVVLLSERAADDTGPEGWAPRAERAVRDSGRPWTILRPSWFMQVFTDARFYLADIVERSELVFPSGGATVAWIDARDIAAVAEQAILDPAHDSQTYELTGPESLTLARTAELLSEVVGRPVAHREVSIEEAVEGMTGFDRDLTVLTFERVRDGSFTPVTDDVARVTGRPARSLRELPADTSPA